MFRNIIHPARPVLGAALVAAALLMVVPERVEAEAANCDYDALARGCYQNFPEHNCVTGTVCECKGNNIFYYPCTNSYCNAITPLPCATDVNLAGRGEDSDPVAADPGVALDAKPVPEALKIWNSPEMRAKRAAAVLLQRGASEEEFRAECLEDTQACLESVRIRVSDDYTLKYAQKEAGGDHVIISRGEQQVEVMEVPEKPPATTE